jgi:transcriptional regulator with XRE-family HTH domain
MEFKDSLKKLRESKGISQQKLADEIFVSRSAIAKWENGLGLPGKESLQYLSDYFQIEEKELIPGRLYENTLVIKNKKIQRLKIYFVSVIIMALILTAVSVFLLIDSPSNEDFNNHIIYSNVPKITINDVETNYYQKSFEYLENENGNIVFQLYVVAYPMDDTYQDITRLNQEERYLIDVNLSGEITGNYYYLDDNYEFSESDKQGWFNIKTYNLEIQNGEFTLPNEEFEYSFTVVVLNCSFEDLKIHYYYIIDTR